MQVKKRFDAILKEARLYDSQGLYDEARKKFKELADLIQTMAVLKNKDKLLEDVHKRIETLNQKISALSSENETKVFSSEESELVTSLLPDSDETPPEMRLEKAKLLARYGSYEAAIRLFEAVLPAKEVRKEAASGLITSLVKDNREKEAKDLISKWKRKTFLSEKDLNYCTNLIPDNVSFMDPEEGSELDLLPVSSVGIRLENVPESSEDQVDLDVSFQSGNLVSLIISSKDRSLIEDLKVGLRINDMRCYSPVAVFRSSGVIASKHQIDSGPKKGDWCLNIEIKEK